MVATSVLQEVTTGTSLLLECASVPANVPLNYCRFVLPDGTGFSVNEETTSDKYYEFVFLIDCGQFSLNLNLHLLLSTCSPLMGNYFFNPNRKMKHGHCSLIVKKATVL